MITSVGSAAFTTKNTKFTKDVLEGKTAKTVFQKRYVEVDQQAQPMARKLQIGQDLRLMEARHRLHGFDFDHDEVLDQKIKPISRVECHAPIGERKGNLPFG